MTRKDFVLIADAIGRAHRNSATVERERGVLLAAEYIAHVLSYDNPRFSRDKFFAAINAASKEAARQLA